MMSDRCRWCGGTGGECGCGGGVCAHCGGSGRTVPTPFGTRPESILPYKVVSEIANGWAVGKTDDWLESQRKFVRVVESCVLVRLNSDARSVLDDDEVEVFVEFWENPYRDNTLGEFINLIANFVERKGTSR
jgi:hypothetical protein